jgi:hypothetical protein
LGVLLLKKSPFSGKKYFIELTFRKVVDDIYERE